MLSQCVSRTRLAICLLLVLVGLDCSLPGSFSAAIAADAALAPTDVPLPGDSKPTWTFSLSERPTRIPLGTSSIAFFGLKQVVWVSWSKSFQIGDLETGKTATVPWKELGSEKMILSKDGSQAIEARSQAAIWKVSSGERGPILKTDSFEFHSTHIKSARFATDTVAIPFERADGLYVGVWDCRTGELSRKTRLEVEAESEILGARFSPDGSLFLGRSAPKSARDFRTPVKTSLWQTKDGKRLVSSEHIAGDFGWSDDGRWVAAAIGGPRFAILDNATHEVAAVLSDQRGSPFKAGFGKSSVFSPDGRYVFSANGLGQARMFELLSGSLVQQFDTGDPVTQLDVSPDNVWIAAATVREVKVWKLLPKRSDSVLKLTELDGLWKRLASDNAVESRQSLLALVAAGDAAVEYLAGKTVVASSAIDSISKELASDDFLTRERASDKLALLSAESLAAFGKALDPDAAEARLRFERATASSHPLLAKSPALRQQLRAIEALERIGTTAAVKALETIAAGDRRLKMTLAAQDALKRTKPR